ncbi:MAG: hypothetical protein ABTR27_09170, partial [Candidatus Competibacter phosphatis]
TPTGFTIKPGCAIKTATPIQFMTKIRIKSDCVTVMRSWDGVINPESIMIGGKLPVGDRGLYFLSG